jgi:diguanylate cyclase
MGVVDIRHQFRLELVAGVALALELILGIGGDGVVRTASNVILLILAVNATVAAVMAARSAVGRHRRGWWAMTLGLGSWAVGELYWGVNLVVLNRTPAFPSAAGFCYFAFTVLATVAMILFSTRPLPRSRLRLILDGVTVALCLFLLSWVTALQKVLAGYDHGIASRVALLFAITDLMVSTTAVLVLVRAESGQRRTLGLLVSGIVLATVTHSTFAYLVVSARYQSGRVLDLGWAAALITFSVAASVSRRTPVPRRPSVQLPSKSSLWLPYLPLLLAGTVGPALVMAGTARILVPVVVVAVCTRQVLSALENRRLLAETAGQVFKDPLTGLANQALFQDRLAHALMLRQRDGRSVAVVSIELDDFKLVTDTLGHQAADTVLIRVGDRISACVRPGDTAARLGGDAFALLLEGSSDHFPLIAERVVEAFGKPFLIYGENVPMRLSVGVAVAGPDEPELAPETLLRRAEVAMNAAKRADSPALYTYSPELTLAETDPTEGANGLGQAADNGVSRVRLLGELRRAVEDDGLAVIYQPKVDLRDDRIVGVEALLRWPHPQRGMLRPPAFLALVREHGLMRGVTELVLNKSLDDVAAWAAQGAHIPVAVNLFAPFVRDARLPNALNSALRQRDLATDLLTIEITEDMVLSEFEQVTSVLQRLRESGIRVAIDDFGSGYSALSYLRDLTVDEVKLDRHFLASVTENERSAAIVRAVIDLTHDLGVTVVAEGVEDAATASWLRDSGCDIGQGYYFGKPAPAAAIATLVGLPAVHGE